MTAAPATSEVATMALEAVMRGEVDEAAALIGQLEPVDLGKLSEHLLMLNSIIDRAYWAQTHV